jgi:RNA-binding protein
MAPNRMMELSNARKKELRSIGHNLNPIIMIAEKGVTEAIEKELVRALNDHELIKIKININSPTARKTIASELCLKHKADLVQSIGKVALLHRKSKKQNLKLSNLVRPA